MKVSIRTETTLHEHLPVDKVVPPSDKFPFWALYWSDDEVTFVNMYTVHRLTLEEVSEENGTIS